MPESETWSAGRKVPQSQRPEEGRASEEKRREGGGAGGQSVHLACQVR